MSQASNLPPGLTEEMIERHFFGDEPQPKRKKQIWERDEEDLEHPAQTDEQ